MQCRADIELAARIAPGRRELVCSVDGSTASSASATICRASASTIRATAQWSMPLRRTGTKRTRRDEPGRPPPSRAIMAAALEHEAADRSLGGLQPWSENCDADGNESAVSCRQLANSGIAQPGPPDDADPSAARF